MARLRRGIFITFEGGEGAGKSSIIRSIGDKLQSEGYPLLMTREPGGTPLGEAIRILLLTPSDSLPTPKAELLLFLAARAQHVAERIQPALDQKQLVLCDRFQDSSIVYQGMARGLGKSEVRKMSLFASNELEPDLTFYFDVEPSIGLARAGKREPSLERANHDRIESEGILFHQKIRDAFQTLHAEDPKRICWIDAEQSLHVVQESVFSGILHLLNTHVE